jgi:hypothetical protein
MPEVVWSRSAALPGAFQTNLLDEPREPAIENVRSHPRTFACNKERHSHWLREQLMANPAVVTKCANGRLVQRHFALLAALAGPNVHHRVLKVDRVAVQAERLAGPQAADRHQSDQCL